MVASLATPNDTTDPEYQDLNEADDINLTENEITVSELRDALDKSTTRPVRPVTPENPSPRSLSPTTPPPRRMSAGPSDTPRSDPVNLAGFTEDQFVQLVAAITPPAPANERRPQVKISKPQHYDGKRLELRGFVTQCTLYFKAIGENWD